MSKARKRGPSFTIGNEQPPGVFLPEWLRSPRRIGANGGLNAERRLVQQGLASAIPFARFVSRTPQLVTARLHLLPASFRDASAQSGVGVPKHCGVTREEPPRTHDSACRFCALNFCLQAYSTLTASPRRIEPPRSTVA
jgi:hypothetical protein